jgi:hypothetical protein
MSQGKQSDSPKKIPLANPHEPDDKEREKSKKEGQTGQEEPEEEHRCHSNHKRSVQFRKKPRE